MKTKKIEKKFRSLQRRLSAACVKVAIFHGILGINERKCMNERVCVCVYILDTFFSATIGATKMGGGATRSQNHALSHI